LNNLEKVFHSLCGLWEPHNALVYQIKAHSSNAQLIYWQLDISTWPVFRRDDNFVVLKLNLYQIYTAQLLANQVCWYWCCSVSKQ